MQTIFFFWSLKFSGEKKAKINFIILNNFDIYF